ncbi:hypothetical protein M427DRAFT_153846, partial [Gonapodya prolifera JEL478]
MRRGRFVASSPLPERLPSPTVAPTHAPGPRSTLNLSRQLQCRTQRSGAGADLSPCGQGGRRAQSRARVACRARRGLEK